MYLDIDYFPYPHSSEEITEKLLAVLNYEFGILDKVISITSDNAFNMVKSKE